MDDHEDLLFDDLADFNRNLADWLLFSNTERPHHSLRLHSPVQSLLINHPECQRWWTHTAALTDPTLHVRFPSCFLLSPKILLSGAVAQLGARVNGIHEVAGSIPASSTNYS